MLVNPGASTSVAAEEQRPGTQAWNLLSVADPLLLAGYTSAASVLPGQMLALHIGSRRPHVRVQVFRAGWYRGDGARLIWAGVAQGTPPSPAKVLDAATRTLTAEWPVALKVSTSGWVPGEYVIKLSNEDGQRWVPFVVRSPSFRDTTVLLSADTTWQAYNDWGGYSLYHGPDGATRTRAYAVSFDRPYNYGAGAADFAGGERPLIALAERLHLPVAFAADTDLQTTPGLLDGARAVISLGHDEYWSSAMREQLDRARAGGTNLAFFGANAIYRHIRLASLPDGANRLEIDYKDGAIDPLARSDRAEGTWNWPSGPDPRDGDELTGGHYECNPVHVPLVLTATDHWPLSGLSLQPGTTLPGLVGSEFDSYRPGGSAPRHMISLARSPLVCGGRADHADIVYYTEPGGAAGFDAGTSAWVCVLANHCGFTLTAAESRLVMQITQRVLVAFSAGPAGRAHPL
ncbi:MAG: hypothetical protein JWO12_2883 [Frankiales bacterium]|nr:hypothetical protein [Frankiales bacterium]